jgi:hypothetical protein
LEPRSNLFTYLVSLLVIQCYFAFSNRVLLVELRGNIEGNAIYRFDERLS